MRVFDLIIKISKPFRSYLDQTIFLLLSKYNNWDFLDNFFRKPVLIVGNGPSLNKTDFSLFEDHVSIGMNKINLLFEKTSWRPDIIVCVNGSILWQNRDFFNKTDSILIVPPRAIYLGIKKRKNVFILNFHSNDDFSENIKKSIANGVTVSYPCFQLANYLQPKKISIVGIDHSYKFEGNKKEYKKFEGDDMNHFSKDYFKNKMWGTPDLDHSEIQYNLAKNIFNRKQIEVTDFTIGGKLKVFKKAKIESL